MSVTISILGVSVLALLLAGYLGQQYLPPPRPRIVGIDLGTTYSCIGVYHAVTGEVQVIPDINGHQTIPSLVAFTQDGSDDLVGHAALCQAEQNAQNTIYDAKRFIGKQFTASSLEQEATRYPFKIDLHNGTASFIVNSQRVTPELVGSRIVSYLKNSAERHLGVSVSKAVLSVPAEFDEAQRNATRRAAQLAGFEVMRIVSEPTAAAMAYGLHKQPGESTVIVVDLGGGTLDVSLLSVHGGMFQTIAMAGNNHLGGQDINQRLMQYFSRLIEERFGRPLMDPQDRQRLRSIIEDAKLNLTYHSAADVNIRLPSLGPGATLTEKLTRGKFEEINEDLFRRVLEPIRLVLSDVEMSPEDIDEVVLVGGSTRIPRVRELVGQFFGKVANVEVEPELAVVYGVAIQAGIIGGMWPLKVNAVEIHNRKVRKLQIEDIPNDT